MWVAHVTALVSCFVFSGCVLVDSPVSVVLSVHPPTLRVTRIHNQGRMAGSADEEAPVAPATLPGEPKETP